MRLSISFAVLAFLFTFALTLVWPGTVFSQADSKKDGKFEMLDAQTGSVETKHYSIRFELPWRHRRPSPEEIGAMLEQFHAVMDRYFGKPIAQQKQKMLDPDAAAENAAKPEKEGSKKNKDRKKAAEAPTEEDAKDKIRVFMANDKDAYLRILGEHDRSADWLAVTGGLYVGAQRTIYLYRNKNLLRTRSNLLHEATHAYHDVYFPGYFHAYPDWFKECMAKHFENHSWNGKQLKLDGMPPFTPSQYSENAISVLLDFRDWLKVKQAGTVDAAQTPVEEPAESKTRTKKPSAKKSAAPAAAPETPIDFSLIQTYIDEKLNFRKSEEKDRSEVMGKVYSLYWVLGKYLFRERREALVVVLVEMSGDPRLIDKKNVRATREAFYAAFAKAFAEKPLTIEAIGRWLQKNPLDWEYVFSEWQFTDEAFLARVKSDDPSRSTIAVLVYNTKGRIPPFTVRPIGGECSPGLILDFVDSKNFRLIRVLPSGRVIHAVLSNGTWGTAENVGSLGGPVPGELLFAVRQSGGAVEVSINGRSVYRGPCSPRNRFGMLLQGKNAEAAFIPQ